MMTEFSCLVLPISANPSPSRTTCASDSPFYGSSFNRGFPLSSSIGCLSHDGEGMRWSLSLPLPVSFSLLPPTIVSSPSITRSNMSFLRSLLRYCTSNHSLLRRLFQGPSPPYSTHKSDHSSRNCSSPILLSPSSSAIPRSSTLTLSEIGGMYLTLILPYKLSAREHSPKGQTSQNPSELLQESLDIWLIDVVKYDADICSSSTLAVPSGCPTGSLTMIKLPFK